MNTPNTAAKKPEMSAEEIEEFRRLWDGASDFAKCRALFILRQATAEKAGAHRERRSPSHRQGGQRNG